MASDNSSIVFDHSTIAASFHAKYDSPIKDRSPKRSGAMYTPGEKYPGGMNVAPENIDEDRPFFVKIGKDGVLAAPRKLDAQLQSVCNPA